MAVVSPDPVRPRVVIAGGGTGGVTIASWLRRLDPDLEITLVEPSTSHHYQSGWVLVAGGFLPASETSRPEQEVLPVGVRWIRNRLQRFLPELNAVELLAGERLEYDVLIVALGLQLRWTAIPGLVETLGRNGVTSIYSRRFAQATQRIFKDFAGGLAMFTEPEKRSSVAAPLRRSCTWPMTSSPSAVAWASTPTTCSAPPSRDCFPYRPITSGWRQSPLIMGQRFACVTA